MFNQANTIFLFYSSLVRRFFFPTDIEIAYRNFKTEYYPKLEIFFYARHWLEAILDP